MDALIAAFTSYGLSGVVIAALFYNNNQLAKSIEKKITEQSERHQAEREILLKSLTDFHDDLIQLFLKKEHD